MFSFCLKLRITYEASSHRVAHESNKIAAKVRLSVPKQRERGGGREGGRLLLFLKKFLYNMHRHLGLLCYL